MLVPLLVMQAASLAQLPVLLDPATAMRAVAYPPVGGWTEAPRIVSVELQLSADGAPTACHVTETSRSKVLDDFVCRTMTKKWRFAPAVSEGGVAVATVYRAYVSWEVLEKVPVTPSSIGMINVSLPVATLPQGYARPAALDVEFDSTGKADACRTQKSSGSPPGDRAACRQALRDLTIAPPKSGSDLPARAVRAVTVAFATTP